MANPPRKGYRSSLRNRRSPHPNSLRNRLQRHRRPATLHVRAYTLLQSRIRIMLARRRRHGQSRSREWRAIPPRRWSVKLIPPASVLRQIIRRHQARSDGARISGQRPLGRQVLSKVSDTRERQAVLEGRRCGRQSKGCSARIRWFMAGEVRAKSRGSSESGFLLRSAAGGPLKAIRLSARRSS